jgi:biotin synthase
MPGMNTSLTLKDILAWLHEDNPERLKTLWAWADETRRQNVGDTIHLRGLVEISSRCGRQCAYCGLRAGNQSLTRYRMSPDEILVSGRQAVAYGYGTVVLQAGEDFGLSCEWVAEVVRQIKFQTPLAVTLSLGERTEAELEAWRNAGADRYLLRFETSDPVLFDLIHPSRDPHAEGRIPLLRQLKRLGYEVGSGIMVGLPGQTYESIARDIDLFRELDLDMIGIGPFIPHPQTPLGTGELKPAAAFGHQAPNTELMVYKAVALTRLVRPDANIPSTTALATINKRNGRELGLQRGANVLMPNLTPVKYRKLYEIYPAKACIEETGSACNGCLRSRINAIWAAYCPRAGRKEAARAASGGVVLNAAVSKQVRTYGT